MDHPKGLTHISLCAGYGGIDLGLKRAVGAVRTIAFCEIEAFACENLVAKMEAGWLDAAPIWTNLKTFPWEQFRDKVDILSGGFPCQPFSAAGRRAGDDDPRHLWPAIVRGIRELAHPPLVFFENVEGIISSKLKSDGWADPAGTSVLCHVLRELERLGYQATAGVFSAREIGAPHQRKRVFIMGVRSDLSNTGRALVSELLSATKRAGLAYPASRGAEQNEWEPPRVTMGNADRRDKGSRRGLSRVLPEEAGGRQTDQPSRTDPTTMGDTHNKRLQGCGLKKAITAKEKWEGPHGQPTAPSTQPGGGVDNAHSEGLIRDHDEWAFTYSARWEDTNGHNAKASAPLDRLHRQTEPTMGGDSNGAPSGLGYAELCHAVDNRTDELRLLGNGVVPATAERAFRVLFSSLNREE